MSKTSTTVLQTPFYDGTYSINGQKKATTKQFGRQIYGDYTMNKYEKKLYDYAQKTLANIVPNINTFSKETMDGLNSQLAAYQNQGQQSINNMYAPLLSNLKNDIASRFGNFDNSMFLNKLNNIEAFRSNAMAELAENLLAKRNELINNELANRYNLINLLNSLQNQSNNNALNAISSALSLSNSFKGQNSMSSGSSGFDFGNLQSIMSLFGTLF